MHEWGQWDAKLGQPSDISDLLTVAWLRRKRLEARLLAIELLTVLGETSGGSSAPSEGTRNNPGADALLRGMGVAI